MLYDLSHRIAAGMPVYPGDPPVRIEDAGAPPPWRVSALAFGSHTGTHVDAPCHFLPDRPGIGAYPLERFIRPGLVVDVAGRGENASLERGALDPVRAAFRPGWFLVLRTGWDRRWGEGAYFRHPYVSRELADEIVALGASLIAVDALSVDSTVDGGSAAHAALLGADVLIVENLRGLDALALGRPYVFSFAPLALGDLDGAPVRALAWDVDHRF